MISGETEDPSERIQKALEMCGGNRRDISADTRHRRARHMGFNEPDTVFEVKTHLTELSLFSMPTILLPLSFK